MRNITPSAVSLHSEIVENLLGCEFSEFHFQKWNSEMNARFQDDGMNELIPRSAMIHALKEAAKDTERFWTLILRNDGVTVANIEFRHNADDDSIGEFCVWTPSKAYHFGYTQFGDLLWGDSLDGCDYLTVGSQEEIWGQFYSMIAKI